MASQGKLMVSTSPKGGKSSEGGATSSPKAQCLCSPTTHEGSFRCKFHRTSGSSPWKMKRSNSLPANKSVASFSPKSVEST
ncbi:hypothetical protein Pint_13159 [Pistacia integerrima]|uniref:Uncharacterized protein n=1 Tax=Pistacia integerrima TaxID=434235 RepID=A0ACC0Y657_9ROSI|nr:hypothetical protein Pint_13159 [Pistacia integerrima]